MYKALIQRDTSFEGIFIVGVKTTGVFCRPTCRARKPKRENIEFFQSTKEALYRGYRPCKICNPLSLAGKTPNWINAILKEVQKTDTYRMNDIDIRNHGIDSNRLRRWFKKNHNMTFQAYLRSLRLSMAFGHLTEGGKVIDTAFSHGYDSLSGFTDAFKKLTGKSPGKYKTTRIVRTYQILTPLGPMIVCSVQEGICLLEFTDRRMLERELIDLQKRLKATIVISLCPHIKKLKEQLKEFFMGTRQNFNLPLFTPGSEF